MSEIAVSSESATASGSAARGTATSAAAPVQFVSLSVDDDHYGVDIMAVREIKGWSEITPLPEQPEYIRGVIDLRGVTVPILDLRCRFGQGLTAPTPLHVVVVVDIASRLVGLLADQVLDIISANAAQIQPVPRIAGGAEDHVLSGLVTIGGAMTALIDLPHLLAVLRDDAAGMASATQAAEAATQH